MLLPTAFTPPPPPPPPCAVPPNALNAITTHLSPVLIPSQRKTIRPAISPPLSLPYLHAALRRLLLGRHALRQESARLRTAPRPRSHTALARAVVIFADFLADIAAFDVAGDVLRHPHPSVPLAAALAALVAALLTADLLSAVAHWATTRYIPPATFQFFPPPLLPPPDRRTAARQHARQVEAAALNSFSLLHLAYHRALGVDTGTSAVTEATLPQKEIVESMEDRRDVFELLVNSCALLTPALVVLAGWSASVDGAPAVFSETFYLGTLSLASMLPLVDARAYQCAPLVVLRRLHLLKNPDSPGWCRLCGFWDASLREIKVFETLESVLYHKYGVQAKTKLVNGDVVLAPVPDKIDQWPALDGMPQRAMVMISSFLYPFFISK